MYPRTKPSRRRVITMKKAMFPESLNLFIVAIVVKKVREVCNQVGYQGSILVNRYVVG